MQDDFSEKMASSTFVVNAESHLWLCREVLPGMLKKDNGRGKGQIVSVTSMAGIAGMSAVTDYCMSKFAAYGF